MGGRDDLVADERRGGAFCRGIESEIAIGDITGAVEDGEAAKTFDGGTSGACAGTSPSKVADGPPRTGIWVERRLGDAKAKGGAVAWVTAFRRLGNCPAFSAAEKKEGAAEGELIAGALDSGALAA